MSSANAAGVRIIALTDHDTVAGVPEARRCAQKLGMTLVNGIEFSGSWQGRDVHIVGLGFDLDHPVLQEAIAVQQAARAERAEQIGERLTRAGIPGSLAGALAEADGAQPGRPHFARYLVAQGHVKSMSAAFKRYLGKGKVGDVRHQWPPMEDIIAWLHQAGGVAVLAHPAKYGLTRTKMCAMIGAFSEAGGDALEVISGRQVLSLTQDLARIAAANGLASSCGSDFHQPNQPWQALGQFDPLPENCRPVWQLPALGC